MFTAILAYLLVATGAENIITEAGNNWMPKVTNKPKRRLRMPRWSMATMFVGVTIACLVLGLVVRPVEKKKQVVEWLRAVAGVYVMYDFEIEYEKDHGQSLRIPNMSRAPVPESSIPGPAWLRDLIGIDYFANVVELYCPRGGNSCLCDKSLASQICNTHLYQLRYFNKLESVYLMDCSNITDDGLRHLTDLTSLVELHLCENKQLTMLPSEIGKLTKLKRLNLVGNRFTTLPSGIGKLAKLTRLDLLFNKLNRLPSEIGQLENLTYLELAGNPIADADLECLRSLKNLEYLGLHYTKVTKEGVAVLRQALPNCVIMCTEEKMSGTKNEDD